jgi:hypothetical protein
VKVSKGFLREQKTNYFRSCLFVSLEGPPQLPGKHIFKKVTLLLGLREFRREGNREQPRWLRMSPGEGHLYSPVLNTFPALLLGAVPDGWKQPS